jgi:hypothetical protein
MFPAIICGQSFVEKTTFKFKSKKINIAFRKLSIEKLKKFSYSETLKKANKLYLEEKNSR